MNVWLKKVIITLIYVLIYLTWSWNALQHDYEISFLLKILPFVLLGSAFYLYYFYYLSHGENSWYWSLWLFILGGWFGVVIVNVLS